MNSLLLRKMFVAFIAAFGGVLIPAVLNLLDAVAKGVDPNFGKAVLISLVSGAVAAGVRAIIAFLPLNLVPTDKLHTLGAQKPKAVTVEKSGESESRP